MDSLKFAVDFGVIGLLLALSLWCVAVAVERWLFYRRVDPNHFQNPQVFEIALTRRLVVIGTVAANAPYIGLLGTVLGIMLTFHTMGMSGQMAVSTIMVGLSLALKATAVGLLVAIPCVVMNNILRRRVTELLTLYKVQHGPDQCHSASGCHAGLARHRDDSGHIHYDWAHPGQSREGKGGWRPKRCTACDHHFCRRRPVSQRLGCHSRGVEDAIDQPSP